MLKIIEIVDYDDSKNGCTMEYWYAEEGLWEVLYASKSNSPKCLFCGKETKNGICSCGLISKFITSQELVQEIKKCYEFCVDSKPIKNWEDYIIWRVNTEGALANNIVRYKNINNLISDILAM